MKSMKIILRHALRHLEPQFVMRPTTTNEMKRKNVNLPPFNSLNC